MADKEEPAPKAFQQRHVLTSKKPLVYVAAGLLVSSVVFGLRSTNIAFVFSTYARPSEPSGWTYEYPKEGAFDIVDTKLFGKARRWAVGYYHPQRAEFINISNISQPGPVVQLEVRTGAASTFAAVPLASRLKEFNSLKQSMPNISNEYFDLVPWFQTLRAVQFGLEGDGLRKSCIGFQSVTNSDLFYVSGYVCDDDRAGMSSATLGCLIDSLTLTGPLPDAKLKAELERRLGFRSSCTRYQVGQSPT